MAHNAKVNLERRIVRLGEREYQWSDITEIDGDQEETYTHWYRLDRSIYITPDGTQIPAKEIGKSSSVRSKEEMKLRPRRLRVRKPARLRMLRRLRREAERNEEKQEAAGRNRQILSRLSGIPEEAADPPENQVEQGSDAGPRVETVNARLKSEASAFELTFRAAPSKKYEGLYNLGVYLGRKLLGFVDVPVQALIDFGREFLRLEDLPAKDSRKTQKS